MSINDLYANEICKSANLQEKFWCFDLDQPDLRDSASQNIREICLKNGNEFLDLEIINDKTYGTINKASGIKISDLLNNKELSFTMSNVYYAVEGQTPTYYGFVFSYDEYEEQQKIKDILFTFNLTLCTGQIELDSPTIVCIESQNKEVCEQFL